MICKFCRNGANHMLAGRIKLAVKTHAKCTGGTHCDCQCDVTRSMVQEKYRGNGTDNKQSASTNSSRARGLSGPGNGNETLA